MRHRVGQLDSVKAVPYEELEQMRAETAARLKVLEEQYWGKKDASAINHSIRDKYKSYGTSTAAESTIDTPATSKTVKEKKTGGILKNSSAKVGGLTSSESLAKPKFGQSKLSLGDGGGRSRSKSQKKKTTKKSLSPEIQYNDPRQ